MINLASVSRKVKSCENLQAQLEEGFCHYIYKQTTFKEMWDSVVCYEWSLVIQGLIAPGCIGADAG